MFKFIKIFTTILIFLITLVGLFFLLIFTTRQKPEKIEDINIRFTKKPPYLLSVKPYYTAMTWDIGFATRGAGIDFYFEGGNTSRPPYDSVTQWLSGIGNYLTSMDDTDFILLQEIDRLSKRSYNIDQRRTIDSLFPLYARCFANNHNVLFVPVPLRQPYGEISAGMTTLSTTYPMESMRFAFEKKGSFLKKPFMPDICCIINHYRLRNGKTFVMINVYNPPTVSKTEKQKLTEAIISLMITEYEKGNYVLAGGNWGVTPIMASDAAFTISDTTFFNRNACLSESLPNEWEAFFDPNQPTRRSMSAPYQTNSTPVEITDFFIVSPNIHVLKTETVPMNFKYSQHNPVRITFRFM